MFLHRAKPCPFCGVKVRKDRALAHKEQAHPEMLSPEEAKALGALRPKPKVVPTDPKPHASEPSLREQETRDDDEDDESKPPPIEKVAEWLRHFYGRGSGRALGPAIMDCVEIVMENLEARCGEMPSGEYEEVEQRRFEEACRARWEKVAEPDPSLVRARERLFEADSPRFTEEFEEGFRERMNTLAEPLSILKNAGERGVPHLAVALMTDSWASDLAADVLARMPVGLSRNRALVEALFISGDRPPDTAEAVVPTIPEGERWGLFEEVTRAAYRDGIELQSLYWTALFEEQPTDDAPERILPDLGRALHLLYDLGHHSALVDGVNHLLEPFIGGGERVEAVLSDAGVLTFLRTVEERPPAAMPKHREAVSV